MKIETFTKLLGADFYTGVPDSQLKALCDYLMNTYGIDPAHHLIGANEGNCVGLAAGYHLATGRVPVVYMQNSGEGNIINPVASLLNGDVYAMPCIFVIGWRGQPGVHDEPQHVYQGKVTVPLLDTMGIESMVIGKDTKEEDVKAKMDSWKDVLAHGDQVAFVIEKGALEYDAKAGYANGFGMNREEIVGKIAEAAGDGFIVSTTGKISRELFEIRAARGQGHGHDFLTVGSMGHCSSIALGVAINKPSVRIWCIDGDGAALMHMGAMGTVASVAPKNMVHIVLNNEAHETVGGMPTVSGSMDLTKAAIACGYPEAIKVTNESELSSALDKAKHSDKLLFIEIECALGSRKDLGRPTTTALENKNNFMQELARH